MYSAFTEPFSWTTSTSKAWEANLYVIKKCVELVLWIIRQLVTFPYKTLRFVAKWWSDKMPDKSGNLIMFGMFSFWTWSCAPAIYQIMSEKPSLKEVLSVSFLMFNINVKDHIIKATKSELHKDEFNACTDLWKNIFKDYLFDNDDNVENFLSLFLCMNKTHLGPMAKFLNGFMMYFFSMLAVHAAYRVCKDFAEQRSAAQACDQN